MSEQLLSMERHLQAISQIATQTLNQLAVSDRRPAPAKYLAAARNARSLKDLWTEHIRIERNLFPDMVCRDPHFAAYLDRIAAENHAIEDHLVSLSTAPWPRSAQAGMHSMRTRATNVLTLLLHQVERERVTILPLMRRWFPADADESVDSELVTT
jgi:hypothetical protein